MCSENFAWWRWHVNGERLLPVLHLVVQDKYKGEVLGKRNGKGDPNLNPLRTRRMSLPIIGFAQKRDTHCGY